MFNYFSNAELIFGNDTSVNAHEQIINILGKNIFVVTDKGLTELGLFEPVVNKLKKKFKYKNI